ncbi:MAG: methylated-DNA--[protein]-cysteine S-methyltransferase [Chloroflexota bacterium]
MTTTYAWHPSPIGPLLLVGQPTDDGRTTINRLLMQDQKHGVPVDDAWVEDPAAFAEATRQLDEYFAGARRTFDLPLDPHGTPFQQEVWLQLRTIPMGTTTTYGDIAARVGRPHASRAVGAAIGRNPIAIVVPCHRVVGASGALTGFAGGVERKAALLRLEGVLAS